MSDQRDIYPFGVNSGIVYITFRLNLEELRIGVTFPTKTNLKSKVKEKLSVILCRNLSK